MARVTLTYCPQPRLLQTIKVIREAVRDAGGDVGLREVRDLVQAASFNKARDIPFNFEPDTAASLIRTLENAGCSASTQSGRIALALDALVTLACAMEKHPENFADLAVEYRDAVIAEASRLIQEDGFVRHWHG